MVRVGAEVGDTLGLTVGVTRDAGGAGAAAASFSDTPPFGVAEGFDAVAGLPEPAGLLEGAGFVAPGFFGAGFVA